MILRLGIRPADLLHDNVRRPVPHLAAGDVPVLNGDNGMLRMLGANVVDHHLTAASECCSNSLGNLLQFV